MLWEPRTESEVVRAMEPFFKQLNALILQVTYVRGNNPAFLMIGDGTAAANRREGGNAETKIPDRAAFWTNGRFPLQDRHDKSQIARPPKEIPCLIVGDFKRAGKFSWQMLNRAYNDEDKREPQRVMNQIHDYMDMHHNRFGYILTERELIMLRRRNDNERWGQLDFSPSIPVSAPEGQLNALMVLWYFHVKYGVFNQDEGYRLQSFYHNCPKKMGGGVHAVRAKNRATKKESMSVRSAQLYK